MFETGRGEAGASWRGMEGCGGGGVMWGGAGSWGGEGKVENVRRCYFIIKFYISRYVD
jgi:hypothetical protein